MNESHRPPRAPPPAQFVVNAVPIEAHATTASSVNDSTAYMEGSSQHRHHRDYPTTERFSPSQCQSTSSPRAALEFGSKWTSGFCQCCEDKCSAVEVVFCSYCQTGYQYHRLQKPFIDMDGSVCCGMLCLDLVLPLCSGMRIMTFHLRQRILERYKIEEHVCKSLALAVCFPWCSLCQQHREMKKRTEFCGGVCLHADGTCPSSRSKYTSGPFVGSSPIRHVPVNYNTAQPPTTTAMVSSYPRQGYFTSPVPAQPGAMASGVTAVPVYPINQQQFAVATQPATGQVVGPAPKRCDSSDAAFNSV